MIPIKEQPEPTNFFNEVQLRGETFLSETNLHPVKKEWEGKDYWVKSLPDMKKAYNRICAYCGLWIPLAVGNPTIDHYYARSSRPDLAYSWSNFRLTCLTLNGRKSDNKDVLDPFTLPHDWFCLEFDSWMIKPASNLSESEKQLVRDSLNRLILITDDEFIELRKEYYELYRDGTYPFTHLLEKAPFVAYEAMRQGLAP